MELFSLLAKLTLDTKEYDREVSKIEGKPVQLPDATIGLNREPLDEEVADIPNTEVGNIEDEPEVRLNRDPLDEEIEAVPDTEVGDIQDEPELSLNAQPFEEALADAEGDAETFSSTVGEIFDGLGGLLVAAGITALVANIIGDLSEAVSLARSLGDNIDKSSRAMGISTDAYQEWSHVLKINGADITDLNRGLITMKKYLQGGDITEDAEKAFDRLGISAKVANGEIKTTEQLMDATLEALADYREDDRDILTMALFGNRNGTKLNAMLDGTSKDIRELKQQAHDLGYVMSEEAVAAAAANNDAYTNMQESIEGFKVAVGEQILPLLTDIYNTVAGIVAFFNPHTWGDKSLEGAFRNVDEVLADTLLHVDSTQRAAEQMIEKLFAMGDASELNAQEQAEWKATAQWLIDNIPSLSSVIDLDTMSITAEKDEVIALTKEWKAYAIERAKIDALQEKQNALAKKTTEWLDAETEATRLEGEYLVKQEKAYALLRRDFENSGGWNQDRLLAQYGYKSVEDINWDDSKIYSQLASAYFHQGWAYAGIGQSDTKKALDELATGADSATAEMQAARDKADALRQEVEKGQAELEEYSANLDIVTQRLTETGSVADETTQKILKLKEAMMGLPTGNIAGGVTYYTHAKGDWDVPYDNYPALLHRDEMVLTATQARQYRQGENGIDVAGLEDRIEAAIRKGMDNVTVRSYINGREVTEEVNRNQIKALKGRRFAP